MEEDGWCFIDYYNIQAQITCMCISSSIIDYEAYFLVVHTKTDRAAIKS